MRSSGYQASNHHEPNRDRGDSQSNDVARIYAGLQEEPPCDSFNSPYHSKAVHV